MQTHGGTAAEEVILSIDREFRQLLRVDWNRDGEFDHELTILTQFVISASVERSLAGSAPEEILLIEGSAAAQLTVEMSGEYKGMPLATLFSPYNSKSPFYGKPIVGAEITWHIIVDTAFGQFNYPQFLGFVQDISPNRLNNTVTLVAADRAELLRRPIQLPYWAVSNEHLNYGEEDSQLVWSHWVIDNCLRLCDVSPSPFRPKFREEIADYPEPNVGPLFYLSGNGSFLPTIGWMDNPNATSFPSAGEAMFHEYGLKHPLAPVDAPRPMGLAGLEYPLGHKYGDPDSKGVLRYWLADIDGLVPFSTHYMGFQLNMDGPNGHKVYDTPLISMMEVRIGWNYALWIDVQAGYARARMYSDNSGNHYLGPWVPIPQDVSHVNVFAQWDMHPASGLRCYLIMTDPWTGNGYHSDWFTIGANPTQGEFDQITGRVTIYQAFDSSEYFFATRKYENAGYEPTEAYQLAKYPARLDRGLNKLSFMPASEKREAWQIITEVAAAEFGSVFWDEYGTFQFWNWHTMKSKQEDPVRTLTLDHLTDLGFTNTIDSVRNVFTINAQKKRAAGIVEVYNSQDVNEFYTPANSWKRFEVWVSNMQSPLTFTPMKYDTEDRVETGVEGNFPSWNNDNPIHGYCVQYLIGGLWQESPVEAGVDIEISYNVDGMLTVWIWNGHPWPIRLASGLGEDSQPAFKIAGTLISDSAPQSLVMTNYESVRKHGPRNLELDGEWRQDFYAQTSAVWDLMQRTAEPIPATDQITIPGDPRLQLGDCIWLHDSAGFGSDIKAQILGITRTYSLDEGLTDQLTIEVCNLPYASGEVARPPAETPREDGEDPGEVTNPGGPGGGTGGARPYFQAADWHWNPIPANPVLDSQSAAIVNQLKSGQHVLNTIEYGNTLRGPSGIDASTPRYNIDFEYDDDWGAAFPAGATMPIPDSVTNAQIAPGGDKHLAVADPTTNRVYSLWIAEKSGSSWSAGWGGATALNGDGRETTGGSTGAGISRFACVVREAEIAAGVIPHALFFSTNMARPGEFRFPATKTDGSNDAGASATIPEGARVQLDPSLNPDSYGLNTAEKAIFVALQKYGAYCGDNGGARMAFLCELSPNRSGSNPGPGYTGAGISGDYYNLTKIPWDKLRVLKSWNGT